MNEQQAKELMKVSRAIEQIVTITEDANLGLEFKEDGEIVVFSGDYHLGPPIAYGGEGTKPRPDTERF